MRGVWEVEGQGGRVGRGVGDSGTEEGRKGGTVGRRGVGGRGGRTR